MINLRLAANTFTTLAGGIDSTQNYCYVVNSGSLPNLPSIGGYFYMDVIASSGYYETVQVTGIDGYNSSKLWIVRGVGGTTGMNFAVGSHCGLRVGPAVVSDLVSEINSTSVVVANHTTQIANVVADNLQLATTTADHLGATNPHNITAATVLPPFSGNSNRILMVKNNENTVEWSDPEIVIFSTVTYDVEYYDISGSIFGEPTAGATVLEFVAPRGFEIATNFAGSLAKCPTAATASYSVQKNATPIATVEFSAATSGVWAPLTTDLVFAAGDVFSVVVTALTGPVQYTSFTIPAIICYPTNLRVKEAVRVATTGPIATSGVGQTVDGVRLYDGDRVLVKDAPDQRLNGIYVVSTGNWARSVDASTTATLTNGAYVFVNYGIINGGVGYVLISEKPGLGTDPIIWAKFLDLNKNQKLDSTGFVGILSPSDITVQQVISKLDTHSHFDVNTLCYDFCVFADQISDYEQIVLAAVVSRTFYFFTNWENSRATADSNSSACSFSIKLNNVTIGTISFAAGSTTGTFSTLTQLTVVPGDTLVVVANSLASIKNMRATLAGQLVQSNTVGGGSSERDWLRLMVL